MEKFNQDKSFLKNFIIDRILKVEIFDGSGEKIGEWSTDPEKYQFKTTGDDVNASN